MKITVIGCGRWGSFHAWHAEKIGHEVTLYGRESSENFKRLKDTRTNEYLSLSEKIFLTNSLADAVDSADVVIISVGAQDLRGFVREMKNVCGNLKPKKFVLCMKGLESGTGKRLTTVFNEVMNNIPTAENPTVLRDGITNEPVKLTSIFSPTSESTNSVSGMIPLTGENLRVNPARFACDANTSFEEPNLSQANRAGLRKLFCQQYSNTRFDAAISDQVRWSMERKKAADGALRDEYTGFENRASSRAVIFADFFPDRCGPIELRQWRCDPT